ncbi:hypothetical protein LXL04_005021 [Taraxacum kok-saghyz]
MDIEIAELMGGEWWRLNRGGGCRNNGRLVDVADVGMLDRTNEWVFPIQCTKRNVLVVVETERRPSSIRGFLISSTPSSIQAIDPSFRSNHPRVPDSRLKPSIDGLKAAIVDSSQRSSETKAAIQASDPSFRFKSSTAAIVDPHFHRMDKYLTRKASDSSKSINVEFSKQSRAEINLPNDLPSDPGMRTRILDYDPNVRDEVRRAYLLKGPCQPKSHNFPYTLFGPKPRRFNVAWFHEYSTWLEYSENQDAAYCLCCYLFKPNVGAQGGGETFVGVGFKNWAHKVKLKQHVGRVNSAHNQAWSKCNDLLNNKQRVDVAIAKHSTQSRIDYDERLVATIDCIRFLLRQGLAFRGNNENETSINRGNFIELLQFLADHNQSIEAVTLKNAPLNLKLTSPDIQKDIVHAAAIETTKLIINDIGESFFSIIVDESRDISIKEQMSVVLRYVDMEGRVIERFLGIEHVPNTTATTLKETLVSLFSGHGLSISNLRGQGYDGASNMKGELGGLKTLILNENASAYYVHCFAHQLQLTLLFYDVIDLQCTELESRFSETSTKLLLFMACLNPNNSFAAFDKNKLIQLARLYPHDFSDIDVETLEDQLETYILDMLSSSDFANLNGIGDLAQKIVETKRDKVYSLVYLLIKLALTLPVSTATVERTFSAMKIVKNRMRNKMGDQWMNDNLVLY